jgi:multiple sugar transport system ATP-binding protein
VTHDQEEALSTADRVAVMMGGRILQLDTPEAIYRNPLHIDVASFIGSPRINIIPAEVRADRRAYWRDIEIAARNEWVAPGPVHLAIRPEALELHADSRPGAIPVCLQRVEFLGVEALCHLALTDSDVTLVVRHPPELAARLKERTDSKAALFVSARADEWLAFGASGERVALGSARPAPLAPSEPVAQVA